MEEIGRDSVVVGGGGEVGGCVAGTDGAIGAAVLSSP